MSLKDNIKKMREEQWYNNTSRLEKIKKKLDSMDTEFFKKIASESAIFSENYQKEPSLENLIAIENWFRKVLTVDIKCTGYHEILDFPDRYEEIVKRINSQLENVENEVSELIKDRKEQFYLANAEQIKLDVV